MTEWLVLDGVTVHHGDALAVMAAMPAESVDSIVTDPPYGLEFMGAEWSLFVEGDVRLRSGWSTPGSVAGLDESNRGPDAHPGAGRPKYHRARETYTCVTCGKRDAFRNVHACAEAAEWRRIPVDDVPVEARAFGEWSLLWAIEAHRVLKPGGHIVAFGGARTWHRLAVAIEEAGFELRDSIAWLHAQGMPKALDVSKAIDQTLGAVRATATPRPGQEFAETLPATPEAAAWQGWATALKPAFEPMVVGRKHLGGTVAETVLKFGTGALNVGACRVDAVGDDGDELPSLDGRWPTNVVLDDELAAAIDASTGSGRGRPLTSRVFPVFRYEAKAPTSERPVVSGVSHPTVKPLDLMRWLVRLVTPAGGVVLDPFAGSGTTAEAAIIEGFRCVTIEKDAAYLPLIRERLTKPLAPVLDFGLGGDS